MFELPIAAVTVPVDPETNDREQRYQPLPTDAIEAEFIDHPLPKTDVLATAPVDRLNTAAANNAPPALLEIYTYCPVPALIYSLMVYEAVAVPENVRYTM